MEDISDLKYVLALRNIVVFPGTIVTLQITDKDLSRCLSQSWKLVIAPADNEGEIYDIGCLAELLQIHRISDRDTIFLLKGSGRVKVKVGSKIAPGCYEVLEAEALEEIEGSPSEEKEYKEKLLDLLRLYNPNLAEMLAKVQPILPLSLLTDQIAFLAPISPALKRELLREIDVLRRAKVLVEKLEETLQTWPIKYYKVKGKRSSYWLGMNLN